MNQPIKNCYWVIPGKLLAREYPRDRDKKLSQEKLSDLLFYGVKAFIDLTAEDDGLLPYSSLIGAASYQRFPIRDVSVPGSPETSEQERYILGWEAGR